MAAIAHHALGPAVHAQKQACFQALRRCQAHALLRTALNSAALLQPLPHSLATMVANECGNGYSSECSLGYGDQCVWCDVSDTVLGCSGTVVTPSPPLAAGRPTGEDHVCLPNLSL